MASYLKQQLDDIFVTALAQAFPSLAGTEVEITLSHQQQLADYQCNSAMKLARLVQLSPRDFAQAWCEKIPIQGLIKKIDIAGPGFINICLAEDLLAEQLLKIYDDPQLGVDCSQYKNQRIIVEFSSPNVWRGCLSFCKLMC